MKFKEQIDIDNEYNYGIEIEFYNLSLQKLYNILKIHNIPIKYHISHKMNNPVYDKWIIDSDPTVSRVNTSNLKDFIGGELSSKILSNNKNDWYEIKKICELLKEYNATINEYCSLHINIDISKHIYNGNFFEIFSKLIAIYEDDISLFYMGEKFKIRETKNFFAQNIGIRLIHKLSKINFDSKDFLSNLMYEDESCFLARDAINFSKLVDNGIIEIRYPNGTLDEKIIQNNINFSLKLIEAALQNRFDIDYLNYLLEIQKNNISYSIMKIKQDPDKFDYLIQRISQDNDDYKSFSMQYNNVIKTKND